MSILTVRKHADTSVGERVKRWDPETGESFLVTAERDRVVEDGDPEAAFLYASAGKRVPKDEAESLGALPAKRAAKQAAPAEDKQAAPAENKSRGKAA